MQKSLGSFTPIGLAIVHPRDTIVNAGWVLLAAIALGALVPGFLYKLCGTFYRDEMASRLPANTGKPDLNPRQEWQDYTDRKDRLSETLHVIDQKIADVAKQAHKDTIANQMSELVEQRGKVQKGLDDLENHPPFYLTGFYLETLMFVWPVFYACLGWLIFILAPKYEFRLDVRRWIGLFVGIEFIYRWPTWARNLPYLRYIERHVYANGNWDISWESFIVQELQALLASALLVVVWAIWSDFLPIWQTQVRECLWGDDREGRVVEFAESFVRLFVHWQICSLVLAGAFLPYTAFFWNYVIDLGDKRYVAHAITMHGLWGITWLLISMPLVWTWYQWNVRYRLEAPGTSTVGRESMEVGEKPKKPEMSSLIGSWNILGSLAGAAVAFGFPIIKEILTHF